MDRKRRSRIGSAVFAILLYVALLLIAGLIFLALLNLAHAEETPGRVAAFMDGVRVSCDAGGEIVRWEVLDFFKGVYRLSVWIREGNTEVKTILIIHDLKHRIVVVRWEK